MDRTSGGRRRKRQTRIRVFARFKPLAPSEQSCLESLTETEVFVQGIKQPFTFDKVFGPESSQQQVFDEAAKFVVDGVLMGQNGCVLAYGQTGAGKSHTMTGPLPLSERLNGPSTSAGMIPRMVEYLFDMKKPECEVKVSYVEIYNEKVRDLLNLERELRLHDLPNGGFSLRGLTEIGISNGKEEVFKIMMKGDLRRSTSPTNMNPFSSRSHSVFMVEVLNTLTKSSAKLVLVDLAGSEKAAKTGAKGQMLEEAGNINRSLSSLGMVVNALARADDFAHVPFRDSKLTRILRDSLAGSSRTSLIVHCSPLESQLSETVSALRFGMRAKHVKPLPLQKQPTPSPSPSPSPSPLQQNQHEQKQQQMAALAASAQQLSFSQANSSTSSDLDLSLPSPVQHALQQHALELNTFLVTENRRLNEQIGAARRRLELLLSQRSLLETQLATILQQKQHDEETLRRLAKKQ